MTTGLTFYGEVNDHLYFLSHHNLVLDIW